ncbi:MAG: TonB-dependent receptor [Verrucomicrobia bacterium]|nr:TonB-dependent receptor [Verrucomicrobiota bacterium]
MSAITGQIINAATQSYLEGAVVELSGTNRTTTTDREGRYQFAGVPSGPVTLVVSYAGLDPQRISASVPASGTVVRNVEMTAEIYKLDKFTVAGEREGTAKAEVLQRLAPNVKAVVSSDTFGNVADGNVGDLLQRMAGMTADYNGPDVRQVSIRGVGAALNSVTMDGQQVASAQSAGTGRAFEFEQASLGNVETIEVTKAPTPDMHGASVGGSVNLVSKSAFDRAPGRIFNYTVGFVTRPVHGPDAATWKQPIRGYGPSMNFLYSDVIGEKRNIGITLTGTYHSQPPVNAISNKSHERKNEPGPVYTYSLGRTLGGATRSRLATGVKIDYRWSDQTVVSLNTSYNFFHENNYSPQQTFATVGVPTAATPQVLATVDANGNRISGGYIHPNYADGITRVFPHPTLSTSSISISSNDKSGRTITLSPMVRHRFPGMQIDYSLNYSNAANYYDLSHNDEKYDGPPTGSVTMSMGNIGWTVDRSKDSDIPYVKQTQGPSFRDLNNYNSIRLTQNDQRGFDTIYGGKFDLRKELAWASSAYIKTGLNYQQQRRKLWNWSRPYDYTGPDGVLGTADDRQDLAQFTETAGRTRDIEAHYFKDRGDLPVFPDVYGVALHQKQHPELWKENIATSAQSRVQGLRLVTEKIAAAYVMGNIRFGPVSVLTGVRAEDTRVNGEGPLTYLSPAERARRAAWVGPVTDPEARRRAEVQFGGRTSNDGQYRNFFPGVHLKYEPFGGFMTRFSWSTGVGRPAFGSIIPLDTVDDTALRVTRSNPELKPQYANSYDLTAEYYFKSQGVVSLGAFKKDIEDYIFTDSSQVIGGGRDNGFDGEYEGYSLTTSRNGGSAKIEGLEFNYQQQLNFLAGWAKGFGVNFNYTTLKTEGNYGGTTVLTTNSLAGFLPKSGNVGVSYRGHGFDLRVLATYRGEYLTSNSTTPALVQYQVAKTTWNWRSRYAFSRNLSVFFDVDNVFAVPLDDRYRLYKDRGDSWRNFAQKIVAGVTGRF